MQEDFNQEPVEMLWDRADVVMCGGFVDDASS